MARTIALTGKGGTGKTTLSALMIQHLLKHEEGPVLAIDADPDANLASLLGIKVTETIGDLREDVLKRIKDFPPGMSKQSYIEAGLHEVIVESGKMDFLSMGRSEGPSCYCFINNLVRQFARDLTPAYPWMVVDNEAGLEHLSRQTATAVDALVVVVNEGPHSIDCARRIDVLVRDLKFSIRNRFYIVNRVSDEEAVGRVKAKMDGIDLKYVGRVHHDAELEKHTNRGEPVGTLEACAAMDQVDELMRLIKEA